jgi:hypothetical protein
MRQLRDIVLILGLIFILMLILEPITATTTEITIMDKTMYENFPDGSYSYYPDKRFILTSNEVFEVKSPNLGLYNSLEIGHSYQVEVTGWKILCSRLYRNIKRVVREVPLKT